MMETGAGDAPEADLAPEALAPETETASPPEADTETAEEREPLPLEEIERRWTSTKEALKRERQLRRETAQQFEEMRKALAELKQDTGEYLPDDIPDPSDDPHATLHALRHIARQFVETQRREAEQQARTAQESEADHALRVEVESSEAAFVAETPDYYDALKHYRSQIADEMRAVGVADSELSAQVLRSIKATVNYALRQGKDPAETFYNLAKARGYRSGQARAQIEAVERGQRSSADVPRGGRRNGASVDNILNSDGAEFDKLWAQLEKQAKGGR